jgi:hypothetical protein
MLDFEVAELDEQTKQKRKNSSKGYPYGSTLARHIIELQKAASQRAATGARLRVIRQLTGMPESFAEKNIQKPLYFGRMIQNMKYILAEGELNNSTVTEETRQAMINRLMVYLKAKGINV